MPLPDISDRSAHATPGPLDGGDDFPSLARRQVADPQLRANLAAATSTIRARRAAMVAEVEDWDQLREQAAAIKDHTLAHLDDYLLQFEQSVTARGGQVHWATDGASAGAIVNRLVAERGAEKVVKVKSMATQEIALNEQLERAGVEAVETDLAELIVQLAGDRPSHILVPAIHHNRRQIRDIFRSSMPGAPADLSDDPSDLTAAARAYLRNLFLAARVAISGANFALADTGTLVVVESEGNGRMCLTVPDTLITVVGIEKLIPKWEDLEVFLELLPRSSTGERMNPYTSMWSGLHSGDGPREFHVILLDNGRSTSLADPHGRDVLRCIRCSACLNVCPVYERTGGHAYGSVYPGPIGAVLSPQLTGVQRNRALPFASTLCGACFEACPVAIDIPSMLVHLREAAVATGIPRAERAGMAALATTMAHPRLWAALLRLARVARFPGAARLPLAPLRAWRRSREVPLPARRPLRVRWRQ